MRNATILVANLQGVATEAIKNMVLAGIGKLIILDGENVSEEDLGAGFFFRDGDVGLKVSCFQIMCGYMVVISRFFCLQRLDVAKSRIESLNPLVIVETILDVPLSDSVRLEPIIQSVDLVCVADWNLGGLVSDLSNFGTSTLVVKAFLINPNRR